MRRFTVSLAVVVVLLVGLITTMVRSTTAQDTTPSAEGMPEGISAESLAIGEVPASLALPATISLDRIRLEPGVSAEIPADDPGLGLILVEAGALTIVPTTAVTVTRGETMATEDVAADTEVTLQVGDSFLGPPNSGGVFRNDGQEATIILVAGITPGVMGTPTP